jgi:alkanesulfonate monooxygenase SsuD/methylene tetrahydromethanopterin reductase-like flavin-dependent oxidoreductase (luciferase family)
VLAKQIATLDHLSGGRVVFGMGFGWNRAEAADHGVDFAARRETAREHVLCMQALWSQEQAEFHGEFVSLDPCWSWPKPVQQPRVTTLVGGGANPRVFAAIAEYADGWMPIGGSGLADALPELRRTVEEYHRDPDQVRVVPFGTVPSDEKLAHYQRLGIDEVVLRVPSGRAEDVLATLDAHAVFLERFGGDGD